MRLRFTFTLFICFSLMRVSLLHHLLFYFHVLNHEIMKIWIFQFLFSQFLYKPISAKLHDCVKLAAELECPQEIPGAQELNSENFAVN